MIRKALSALCLLSACITAGSQTSVTVAQLEATLAANHNKSDKELAHEIGLLALKQRLSTARLTQLETDLPGEKSRQALLAISDESAFLELPAAEILPDPPPDRARQKAILSRAIDFVGTTVPKMPSFFATREITRFQSLKPAQDVAVDSSQGMSPTPRKEPQRSEPFRFADSSQATVLYRDGKEVVEASEQAKKKSKAFETDGLNNWGEFGPLLAVVMSDILSGKLGWLHWEQSPSGPIAVFRYQIEKDKSHYVVRYCCVPSSDPKKNDFETVPPYHGEIALDPSSGAVMRFTLETELDSTLSIKRAAVAMEYGPVEIGGVSYICPIKSIAFSHAVSFSFAAASVVPATPRSNINGIRVIRPPETISINDTAFTKYHMYRYEIRIVPDSPDEGSPKASPPSNPDTPPHR